MNTTRTIAILYYPRTLEPTGERKQTWGWHLFPDFSAITKADFSHRKRGSVQIECWDEWEMRATRPDAHVAWIGSGLDCLHVSSLRVTLGGKDLTCSFLVVPYKHSSTPYPYVVSHYP